MKRWMAGMVLAAALVTGVPGPTAPSAAAPALQGRTAAAPARPGSPMVDYRRLPDLTGEIRVSLDKGGQAPVASGSTVSLDRGHTYWVHFKIRNRGAAGAHDFLVKRTVRSEGKVVFSPVQTVHNLGAGEERYLGPFAMTVNDDGLHEVEMYVDSASRPPLTAPSKGTLQGRDSWPNRTRHQGLVRESNESNNHIKFSFRTDDGLSPAPGFTVSDLAGTTYSLSALKGKVVVLNFWATWCGPCRNEIPALNALKAKYPAIVLLGVTSDNPAGGLAATASMLGIQYPVVAPNWSILNTYRPLIGNAIPVTVFIQPDGDLARILVGSQSAASLEHTLLEISP